VGKGNPKQQLLKPNASTLYSQTPEDVEAMYKGARKRGNPNVVLSLKVAWLCRECSLQRSIFRNLLLLLPKKEAGNTQKPAKGALQIPTVPKNLFQIDESSESNQQRKKTTKDIANGAMAWRGRRVLKYGRSYTVMDLTQERRLFNRKILGRLALLISDARAGMASAGEGSIGANN
jgi:hypothetical protein